MTQKAVITAAGLGTRLLSATKSQPKEMLPVFSGSIEGGVCMKPIVQLVFEDLFRAGYRDFCFVVGRGQRTIREHFTADQSLVSILDKRGRNGLAKELEVFYRMLEQSDICWVNQLEPLGFGDAVKRAEHFIGDDRFLVHAGDSFFISKDSGHLRRLLAAANSLDSHAVFMVQQIQDPRSYGVVDVAEETNGLLRVRHVVEKPDSPKSRLAIMPVYVFRPSVFEALRETSPGYGGELQLTDGIQKMIRDGVAVYGLDVNSGAVRLDVGSPDSYMEAQLLSYKYWTKNGQPAEQPQALAVPVAKTI